MNEYDPITCTTAEELRESGFPIPKEIPDCAWLPRGSFISTATVDKDVEAGLVRADIEIKLTSPFQWIEASFTLIQD